MLRVYTGGSAVRTGGRVTRGGLTEVSKKVVVVPAIFPALEKRELGVVLVMGGSADLIESGGLLMSIPTNPQDRFRRKSISTI